LQKYVFPLDDALLLFERLNCTLAVAFIKDKQGMLKESMADYKTVGTC
jgi:phage gp36-like protein